MRRFAVRVIGVLLAAACGVTPALAQLNTQHLKGGTGLKAASQPPPHTYVALPLLYVYNTDQVIDRNGNKVPIDASINSVAYGAGIFVVTTKKVLGANYGFQVFFPLFADNRLQGTEIDQNPGAGITDSVFAPLHLGWHFKQADAVVVYNIFAPTGRYTDGAANNTGFGMWGQEIQFGTTVFLNEKKQYHAATLVSLDFQSKKEDSDTKVGNMMILEGGSGADLLKGGLTVGLAYYAAFKLAEDDLGSAFANALVRGKNRQFALGPEASLALARKGMLYGFLKVNYEWETYARTATKGNEFNLMLTWLVKPIKIPG